MFRLFYEQTEARHATMSLYIPVESVSPPYQKTKEDDRRQFISCKKCPAVYSPFIMCLCVAFPARFSLELTIGLLFLECSPLVVELFAAGKTQFNLGLAIR